MASRQIKMPAKNNQAKQEAEEVFSQSKRPERGRYLLTNAPSGLYYTPSMLLDARCVEQLPGSTSIRVE